MQIIGTTYLRKNTSFYQCTVETLLFIAILMLLPGQLWEIVLARSRYHLKTTYGLISAAKQAVGCQRTTITEDLARHLETSRRYHRLHRSFDQDLTRRIARMRFRRCHAKFHRKCYYQNRYFVPFMFLLIKILYIIIIVAVYFVLSYCLGFNYIHLGFSIIEKIAFNQTSTFLDEQYFPQRTWCQISRPKLGGMDQTWADCVLPINVINNIIFSLLWFWLMSMLLIAIFGLIQGALKMMSFSTHLFLGHHLQVQNQYEMEQNGPILDFIEKCPPDVTLMLRIYEIELGRNLTGEIIAQLFTMYKNNHSFLDDSIAERLP